MQAIAVQVYTCMQLSQKCCVFTHTIRNCGVICILTGRQLPVNRGGHTFQAEGQNFDQDRFASLHVVLFEV